MPACPYMLVQARDAGLKLPDGGCDTMPNVAQARRGQWEMAKPDFVREKQTGPSREWGARNV